LINENEDFLKQNLISLPQNQHLREQFLFALKENSRINFFVILKKISTFATAKRPQKFAVSG